MAEIFPEEHLGSPLGYFPLLPGQKLDDGRWTVVRKLGWGPRSSTWLAQGSKETGGQYKALKILTAAATADSSGNKERDALLGPVKSMTHGVPELLSYFYEHDPSGKRHLCLVFRTLSTSVEDLRLSNLYDGQYLPTHVVQKIIGDVAERLVHLAKHKYIHGAVTADNFYFWGVQTVTDVQRELAKSPNERPIKIIGSDGETYSTVKSQPLTHGNLWDSTAEELFDVDIYLCNYGHARPTGTTTEVDFARNYASPEVLKGERVDPKADIWTLGCTAYLLLTGTPLFEDKYTVSPVETATETLGNLDNLLKESGKLSDEDVPPTASFLRSCLAIKSTHRASAADIASSAWIKSGCKCAWCSK